MSHADTGQQQGDFREAEGKCERDDGNKHGNAGKRSGVVSFDHCD